MTAELHYLERSYYHVIDASLETIDIMLSPDILKPYTAISNLLDSDASPLTGYNY